MAGGTISGAKCSMETGSDWVNLHFRIGSLFSVTLSLEVFAMDDNYRIADLTSEYVAEINELQEKLKEQTKEDIVLVAYKAGE